MTGVYKITCISNSKYYIGSSTNIHKRWICHRSNLNKNKHHNPPLQNAWNKYGSGSFIFEILEHCEADLLQISEEYYLNIGFEKDAVFNIFKNAYSLRAENHPMFGKTHTYKAKALIKEARSKQTIKHSEETKRKIGDRHKGKIANPEHMAKMLSSRNGKAWNKGIKTGIVPRNKISFNQSQTIDILAKYEAGNSVESLRKAYNISWDAMVTFLKSKSITLRNISQQKQITDAQKSKRIN